MHLWGRGREGRVHPVLPSCRACPSTTLVPAYFDSCFCSKKRSSSSWTWSTKSFSVGERKTPSKQRRARVIGGRACRADGQGPGQRTDLSSPPSPAESVLPGTRRHRGPRLPSDKREAGSEVGKGRAQVPRHRSRGRGRGSAPRPQRAAPAPGPDAAGRSGPCCARCPGLGTLGPGGESGRPGPPPAGS